MSLRLLVTVVVAAVGLLAAALVRHASAPELATEAAPSGSAWARASADATAWDREFQYLERANEQMFGSRDHPNGGLAAPGMPNVPGAVRILVLGDSFVYGSGLADPDARWWVKMQDALDEQTAPGAFEVRALGAPGAGTTMQRDWLLSEPVRRLDPDIVIVGYVVNDPVPHPHEIQDGDVCGGVCPPSLERTPEWGQCLSEPHKGDVQETCTSRVGTLHPSAVSEAKAYEAPLDPAFNPYTDSFQEAVANIGAAVDVPLLWMPTPSIASHWGLVEEVRPVFEAAGFTPVTPTNTLALLQEVSSRHATPDVHVSPRDLHPGPRLTTAIAQDAANAILGSVPAERLREAVESALSAPPEMERLVSWVLPASATVSSTASEANIVVTRTEATSNLTGVDTAPTLQVSPCAALDRPHARIVLSRLLTTGLVSASLTSGPSEGVDIYAFGYALDGTSLLKRLGSLASGEQLPVPMGPEVRGILVAPRDSTGCPPTESLELPDFSVQLRLE